MGTIQRWQEYARQYGFSGLITHLVARTIRPVWERASAQILVLEPPVPARTAKVPLQIRIVDQADGLTQPGWEQRWSRGDVCYGAWAGGVCVHHSWVTTQDSLIGEVHGRIKVAAGEAYVYDCFTSAESRGQGIFPAVLSHIGRGLVSSGTLRIWIAVEHENRSSIKAIERAGFRLAGEVSYRRFGGSARVAVAHEPNAPSFDFASGSVG
ncbi:MAG TPA: GNAT family N-acetyltransferase [Symbiobacteriaceae bacterium]|nr:GNAT family N-acetyltransferase [Symbiobacteriaceae bacterium]